MLKIPSEVIRKYTKRHLANFSLPLVRIIKSPPNLRKVYIKKDYRVPSLIWFTLGIRGTGKSSFLEFVAELYFIGTDAVIMDIYGSADGENLAWLRSPWVKLSRILLLHHPDIRVVSKRSNIQTLPVDKFTPALIDKYDIILSTTAFYPTIEDEYEHIENIVDMVYYRKEWGKGSKFVGRKRKVVLLVREAARLLYSRGKIADRQKTAKSKFINLLRESRHAGVIMLLDTQKFKSVDKDIRDQIDNLVIKNMGIQKLPDDLAWIYGFIDPAKLSSLEPHRYVLLTKEGILGLGVFPYPKWHKDEDENIFDSIPIEIIR